MNSLTKNKTWEIVSLSFVKRVIDSKWIFKIKPDKNGKVDKYKTRFIIKGYLHQKRFDYDKTYAFVARLTTLRVLSIMIEQNLIA